jgi:peroxiredoxin
MRMLRLFLAMSLISFTVLAQPPMPRKAPELTIVEPSGKQSLLSSYRGKVVALAFIFTTCPHCQAETGVLNKLQGELGPKGFQALAVAFNDNANLLVGNFIQNFHPAFPVGSADRKTATDFLQVDDTPTSKGWNVPQMVLIDRKGMIVAQSAAKGSEELQEENSLRTKINSLLVAGAAKKKSGH